MESRSLDRLSKGQKKIWSEVERIVSKAVESGDLRCGESYSVEYVGQKFNDTPCVNMPVGICIHSHQSLSILLTNDQKSKITWPCRTFEDFEKFFSIFSVEGIIIEHNRRCWKVKAENFPAVKSLSIGYPKFSRLWRHKIKAGKSKKQHKGVQDLPDHKESPKCLKEYWRETLSLPGWWPTCCRSFLKKRHQRKQHQ
eukprot:718769_1